MGKFLDEVLEISYNHNCEKITAAMNIINNINEKIKECAKHGYTEIYIQIDTGNGGRCLPVINAKNIKTTFIMQSEYKSDKVIYDYITNYYRKEEFFISGDFEMISWHKALENYLKHKEESKS